MSLIYCSKSLKFELKSPKKIPLEHFKYFFFHFQVVPTVFNHKKHTDAKKIEKWRLSLIHRWKSAIIDLEMFLKINFKYVKALWNLIWEDFCTLFTKKDIVSKFIRKRIIVADSLLKAMNHNMCLYPWIFEFTWISLILEFTICVYNNRIVKNAVINYPHNRFKLSWKVNRFYK